MEDTLRDNPRFSQRLYYSCLNPCFNGRYSQRRHKTSKETVWVSLNPCFNGRYSQSVIISIKCVEKHGLNPCFNGRYSQSCKLCAQYAGAAQVLILVLMEDTLRVYKDLPFQLQIIGLNPCFNGRYSQSVHLMQPTPPKS